jgi:hypothetical protein
VELSLRFEGPLPEQGTAELFRLANTLEERANVYVTATSMVFRPPVRATRWRFWSPSVRFPLPGDGAAGAQTEVRLRAARGAVFYEGAAHGDTIRASRRLSAGDGYRLFLSDVTLPRFSLMLLAAGWLGVLFAPFGVWAATSRKAGLAMAAAAVPAAVGFLAVPALLGMPIAGLGDWGAAIAMCLVGWVAGRLLTRHQNAMGPQLPGEAP